MRTGEGFDTDVIKGLVEIHVLYKSEEARTTEDEAETCEPHLSAYSLDIEITNTIVLTLIAIRVTSV